MVYALGSMVLILFTAEAPACTWCASFVPACPPPHRASHGAATMHIHMHTGVPDALQSNHRSWADFFIDAYLTEGRGQMMSRMAVLYAFPAFMIPVALVRGCIVFKRGHVADKVAFNAWIDKRMALSPQPGICLFPEGAPWCWTSALMRGMRSTAMVMMVVVSMVVGVRTSYARSCTVATSGSSTPNHSARTVQATAAGARTRFRSSAACCTMRSAENCQCRCACWLWCA